MTAKFLKDENALLEGIAKGDTQAFTVVYNFYQPRIYSFCLPILHSELLAEEVVQETLLKVWQMGVKVRAINSLDGYLKTISRNLAIDLLRKQQLERRIQNESQVDWTEEHNDTEEAIVLNEIRRILEKGIAELPPQQKLVYQYISQEGLLTEEVASKMNITKSTTQTHLKLAKRHLRQYLQKHSDISVLAVLFNLF